MINSSRVARLVEWLSYERFAAIAAFWYASFVLHGDSFSVSGWTVLQRAANVVHLPPTPALAGLLYLSALFTLFGLYKNKTSLRMYGSFFGFMAFGILTACQVASMTPTTGIPAYSILAGGYLLGMLRRAFNVEWVPFSLR